MWSWIVVAGTMLVLMNSCGSSRPLPAAQGNPTQSAMQTAEPGSSIQRLRVQAERGNVEAQFALAQAYDRGRGVLKDKTEAVRWYRFAAMQGDAFAQNALGDNYWEGMGVPKNDREAARWWRLAASQGFAPAQHSLGKILSGSGTGAGSDKVQAYMWLALSAAQGDEEAARQGNSLSRQLTPTELTTAKQLVKQWKPARARITIDRIAQ
jgi:uncharacterized protein